MDGSNNSDIQLYPIVATYYIEEAHRVKSRHLCLTSLQEEASGRKIGNLILDVQKSWDIPIASCLSMSADNKCHDLQEQRCRYSVKGGSSKFDSCWMPLSCDQFRCPEGASHFPAKVDEM